MSQLDMRDVEWWTRALSARNGSNRGMAEFVVETITATDPDPVGTCPLCGGTGTIYDVTAAIEGALSGGMTLAALTNESDPA